MKVAIMYFSKDEPASVENDAFSDYEKIEHGFLRAEVIDESDLDGSETGDTTLQKLYSHGLKIATPREGEVILNTVEIAE